MTNDNNVTPITMDDREPESLAIMEHPYIVVDVMGSKRRFVQGHRTLAAAENHAARRCGSTQRNVGIYKREKVYGVQPVQMKIPDDPGPDAA